MVATALKDLDKVLDRLAWMRRERIWPNGLRYLWTDAFGLVLLVSLWRETGDERFLQQAEHLVAEVERVLGRPRGLRIGEAPERDGQYYHYLAMWIFALTVLGEERPRWRRRAVDLVHEVHAAFVVAGRGVVWKMREDLSAPYPGFGLGAMDAFDGYVVYRRLDERELAPEIAELRQLVEQSYENLVITQDLGLGMMLWLCHFHPHEEWAREQQARSLQMLDRMWIDPPGYFCREPSAPHVKFAFTNYGDSLGLQSVGAHLDRVRRLNAYFEHHRSGTAYDRDAITHVMACTSWFPGAFV